MLVCSLVIVDCKVSTLLSSVVTRVENEPLSVFNPVTLVENEPLSVFNAATLVEKLPLSVLSAEILAVA